MDHPPSLFSTPFCSSLFLWLLTVEFLVSIKIPSCSSKEDWYTKCSNNFTCGSLTATYPFWGASRPSGCGIPELQLTCQTDTTSILIKNVKYRVLEIHPNTQIIRIVREDFSSGICSPLFISTSLDPPLLDYVSGYSNITFVYGCLNLPVSFLELFNCDISGIPYQTGYVKAGNTGFVACYNSVYFPVSNAILTAIVDMSAVEEGIKHGFEVQWNVDGLACNECTGSNGVCGYDLNSSKPTCYCPDQYNWLNICSRSGFAHDPASASSDKDKDSNNLPLAIGLSIAGAAAVGLILGGWFMYRRKRKAIAQTPSKEFLSPSPFNKIVHTPTNLSMSIPSYPYSNSKSDMEKGSTYFGVQVFSFTELEEATDNFDPAKELGSGGFGTVYYGVLRDGRSVAVKRLFDNNVKRAEQFMNEVEILHDLRHPNLVTLHGCTSRKSKELILVYEYIPNGTVADHIHRGKSNSAVLTWPVRLSIAVETADALTYLHTSDVIHRDVKTNNILLDNKFHVKVADFGLSRLFPNNCTHVSTAPQGTPGYVDPEYYHTYQLTDKSDVYSFGVVLIELISSLEAVDTNRDRHHINLASMAITKIQNQSIDELIDPSLGFEKDPMVRKMAKLVAEVAFRCLQQERDMRPTMGEVLQILRKIQSENSAVKAKELDGGQDDIGLLKHVHPPLSPDSVVNGKWISSSTLSSY